jgi:hypothetical protein
VRMVRLGVGFTRRAFGVMVVRAHMRCLCIYGAKVCVTMRRGPNWRLRNADLGMLGNGRLSNDHWRLRIDH